MKKTSNNEIKAMLKKNGITYLDLAEALNTSESSIYRMLRREITDEFKAKIQSIVEELKRGD